MKINRIINEDLKEIIEEMGSDLLQFEGKKVLITGASGMLASYLVKTLIYANQFLFKTPVQIYLIIRKKSFPFGKNNHLQYLFLDISKKIPNVKNINYIIHAASKAAPKIYLQNSIDTLNSNILGLYNLLKICTPKTQSFLFFSSGEIYGQLEFDQPVNEQTIGVIDHLNKRSCYVEAKRVCETICLNYFWEKKLPVKIVRIFHTFGPGLNLNDGRVFSDFIRDGLLKKDIQILGDKTIKRPILYIKDATIMFLKILLSDKNGEVYNISNTNNIVSVGDFSYLVCDNFNQRYDKKLKVKELNNLNTAYYQHVVKSIIPDTKKFINEFHYQPTTNINTAISRTIDFLMEDKKIC